MAGSPDPLGSGDLVPTPAGRAACGEKGAEIGLQHLQLAWPGVRGGAQQAPDRGCSCPGRVSAQHPRGAAAREKREPQKR